MLRFHRRGEVNSNDERTLSEVLVPFVQYIGFRVRRIVNGRSKHKLREHRELGHEKDNLWHYSYLTPNV